MGTFVDKLPQEPFSGTFSSPVFVAGSGLSGDLVEAKFNHSKDNSDLMLLRLWGADGTGGYLGELATMLNGPIEWAEVSPDNSVFPTLLARLLNDLAVGATGVSAAVEAEYIARAQARQDLIDEKQENETLEFFAARGFTLPTGAAQAEIANLAAERARNRTDLNGKVLIMQAELAQKNSQFIIGMAKDIEAILRDYANQVNNRALEYAKAIAGLREKIVEAMANIGMQSVASWASSFHASAGVSHSTGISTNESFSHSEQREVGYSIRNGLDENHSYKEA